MRGSIDDRARDRRALLLAARQRDAALADHRVVALRESRRRPCRAGRRPPRRRCAAVARRISLRPSARPASCPSCSSGRCPPSLSAAPSSASSPNATLSASVSENRNGSCGTKPMAPRSDRERHVAHVDAVDEHRARRRIVQPRQQADQRRLARSRWRRRARPSGRPRSGPRRGRARASPS